MMCPPLVKLSEQFVDKPSPYAEEGTALHELRELKLRHYRGDMAPELIEQQYAEHRLDYSEYIPEEYGTGDLVIIADGIIEVIDFKGCRGVRVDAYRNSQLMLYGLGALLEFDPLYDIHTVRVTIVQPRLSNTSTYEISADELIRRAETEVRPKALLAYKCEDEFCMPAAESLNSWVQDLIAYTTQQAMDGDPKYSVSLIIPKTDTETVGKVQAAIEEAKQNGNPKWGGKIPPNLKLPLRDGDVGRPDDEAYADSYFINATSPEKPGVVDRRRVPITDPLTIYSGCYIRVSINFYPFNANGNCGIAVSLSNIQ